MLKQTSLCSVNTFLPLKHYKQLLQKYFLFLFFLLWNINLSKSLMYTQWLVFISYKQQIHWVFKILIWNVDWKSQLVFVTVLIDANTVLFFNFATIFFLHRKFNPIIITIINKLFIILWNYFWMYFWRIKMPNMTPKKTLLIVIFDIDLSFFWTF